MDADSDLPPLQARWISALLPGPVPREKKADCGDCVMCPGRGAEPEEAFDPSAKCCTFVPAIPNFLAGRALADPALSGEGRRSLQARIAGPEASPLGLGVSDVDQDAYRVLRAAGLFGKPGAGLRCPHYHEGRCGVWRHRPAVCATWFCRHERGRVGRDFWGSIRRLLAKVEDALGVWCVLRAGFEPDALGALFPEDGPADLDRAWGPWRGREAEFYMDCARRVEPLRWDDVLRVGGVGVEALSVLAAEAFQALARTALPPSVQAGAFRVAGGTRLRAYLPSDWIDVPSGWLDFLLELERESTPAVLGRLRAAGAPDPEAVVRALLDLGILGDG